MDEINDENSIKIFQTRDKENSLDMSSGKAQLSETPVSFRQCQTCIISATMQAIKCVIEKAENSLQQTDKMMSLSKWFLTEYFAKVFYYKKAK